MIKGGLEFFPNRDTLVRKHGTLGQRLQTASSVSGIWVVGQKFFHAGESLSVLKKLLLPHPDGQAFRHCIEVSGYPEIAALVRTATDRALKAGTKVRWYDPFICSSILLVDTDKPSGWAHVELVLPYSKVEQRPSFTVFKRQSEQTVSELQRIFEEIWDSAKDAPRS